MLEESMNLPLTEPLMHWKLSDKQWHIRYIAKSIGTPYNERLDYFSNFHEYKS